MSNAWLYSLRDRNGVLGPQSLDTGEEFDFGAAEKEPKLPLSFADTLLQLLDSLNEPVIPAALHSKCAQTTNRDEAFEVYISSFASICRNDMLLPKLLENLPVVNVNVSIRTRSNTSVWRALNTQTVVSIHQGLDISDGIPTLPRATRSI